MLNPLKFDNTESWIRMCVLLGTPVTLIYSIFIVKLQQFSVVPTKGFYFSAILSRIFLCISSFFYKATWIKTDAKNTLTKHYVSGPRRLWEVKSCDYCPVMQFILRLATLCPRPFLHTAWTVARNMFLFIYYQQHNRFCSWLNEYYKKKYMYFSHSYIK